MSLTRVQLKAVSLSVVASLAFFANLCLAQPVGQSTDQLVSQINHALALYPTDEFSAECPGQAQDQIKVMPDRRHIAVDAVYWDQCKHYGYSINVLLLNEGDNQEVVSAYPGKKGNDGELILYCKNREDGTPTRCATEATSPHMWDDDDGPRLLIRFGGTNDELNKLKNLFIALITTLKREAASPAVK
jgi:hypothetical protein